MKVVMIKAERDEDVRVGTISLVDGKLTVDGEGDPNAERILKNTISITTIDTYPLKSRGLYKGSKEFIKAKDDPKAFLLGLPFHFRGRFIAELVED